MKLIATFSILLFLTGCSAFTRTQYEYYPLPEVNLQPCQIPQEENTVGGRLIERKILLECVKNSNADKKRLKAIIEGSLFTG